MAVVGFAGAAGTAAIARLEDDRLSQRFSRQFIERCRNADRTIGSAFHSDLMAAGAADLMEADDGGIMAALWYFFEGTGFGFDIELKKIPILQETVEICELLDFNPYCLRSAGCFLFTADNGGDVVRTLAGMNIDSAVIGKVAMGPGKRIHNGEIHSFLNRPKREPAIPDKAGRAK